MKQFAKLNVQDRKLSLIQDALSEALNPLLKLPLNDSNLLHGIKLVAGTNTIAHGLNRVLIGWIVVRKNTNETIYDDQDKNPLPGVNLTLVSSGDSTVSLVVF